MSSPNDNRARFRPATISAPIAGAGSALVGLVFISFAILALGRHGFNFPAFLVGVVGGGLLLALGVWILIRPNRPCLILTGSILLLIGAIGFFQCVSDHRQPAWALAMSSGLMGLGILSLTARPTGPSSTAIPTAPALLAAGPAQVGSSRLIAWLAVLLLALVAVGCAAVSVRDAMVCQGMVDEWLKSWETARTVGFSRPVVSYLDVRDRREYDNMHELPATDGTPKYCRGVLRPETPGSEVLLLTVYGQHGTLTIPFQDVFPRPIDRRPSEAKMRDFWTLTDKKYVVLAGLGLVGIIGIFVFRPVANRKRRHGSTVQDAA